MLSTNIINEKATKEQAQELIITLSYEKYDMMCQELADSITKINKKIENKIGRYTTKQVEGFKEERKELEDEKSSYEKKMSGIKEVHDTVLEEMCSVKSVHGNMNRKNSARNLFRIIAGCDCNSLIKYVMTDVMNCEELWEQMEICHNLENSNEYGQRIGGGEIDEAYKKADKAISKIIKDLLSIEVENPYTTSVRIRLNKTDLRKLHALYIRSISVKFEKKDKDDTSDLSTYAQDVVKTSISRKVDKKGVVSFESKDFAQDLCKILVKHLASK